jgi:hypothetical protein
MDESPKEDLEQFLGVSLQMEVWVLHWREAVQKWSSDEKSEQEYGALLGWRLLEFIDKYFESVRDRIGNWQKRITACDPAGSSGTYRDEGESWPTAHDAFVDYFLDVLKSRCELIERTAATGSKEIPPAEFMAWMEREMLPERAELVSRVTRERDAVEKEYAPIASLKQKGDSIFEQSRIVIDIAKQTIIFDGKTFGDINSVQALRWLQVLIDHPGEYISGKDLSRFDGELINVRTDKLKPYLPNEIADLIESQTGAGSRLRIERNNAVAHP